MRVRWRAVTAGATRRDVAWGLLRELLPAGATLSNPCPRCGLPHGPVRIDGAPFTASVSYAPGWAVVAIASIDDVAAVGVDAEAEVDERRDAAGLTGVLGDGVEATLRDWTRVEAALKADGRGLRVDPARVRVVERDAAWTAEVPGADTVHGWDVAGPPGVTVSVALRLSR